MAEAQRSRVHLQTRVTSYTDELEQLRAKVTLDTRRIHELTLERNTLAMKVRDRDAELKGKAKLLEVSRPRAYRAAGTTTLSDRHRPSGHPG